MHLWFCRRICSPLQKIYIYTHFSSENKSATSTSSSAHRRYREIEKWTMSNYNLIDTRQMNVYYFLLPKYTHSFRLLLFHFFRCPNNLFILQLFVVFLIFPELNEELTNYHPVNIYIWTRNTHARKKRKKIKWISAEVKEHGRNFSIQTVGCFNANWMLDNRNMLSERKKLSNAHTLLSGIINSKRYGNRTFHAAIWQRVRNSVCFVVWSQRACDSLVYEQHMIYYERYGIHVHINDI